ncbi:MAG: hypothetical protein P8189_21325 [Anaerolineae bacterium]|jgi:hypothetical protein
MPLDLWFREDVARILASAHETMQASTAGWSRVSPSLATVYRQGFDDALRAVGIAFGVANPTPPRPIQAPEHVLGIEAKGPYTRQNQEGDRS